MEITLSTGQTIELCHIPPGLRDVINARFPLPEVPIVETVTATGSTLRMAIEDDPDYLAACEAVEEQRNKAWNEGYTLAALKNLKVPDDFDMEAEWGDELRYLNPEWEPRPGKMGQKLDYIEFVLNSNEHAAVSEAINEMMGIDTEVIDAIEDSFPGDVPEEAD